MSTSPTVFTSPRRRWSAAHPSAPRWWLVAAPVLGVLALAGMSRADLFGGLFSPKGDTVSSQQATINSERDAMLSELYAWNPALRDKIAKAPGYATFKKTDLKILLVSSGNGYGALVNNQAGGQETYMRVASLGGGVGLGVQDLRIVIVFNDANVMNQFLTQGWEFGGTAGVSAQAGDTGVSAGQSVNSNVDFSDGTVAGTSSSNAQGGSGSGNSAGVNAALGGPMEIYRFTENGIALQATVSGTKYWVDSSLNN